MQKLLKKTGKKNPNPIMIIREKDFALKKIKTYINFH